MNMPTRKILAALPLTFAAFSALALDDSRVFAFAESNFPGMFKGNAASGMYQDYNYRCYATRYCLAVRLGGIYMVGPNPGDTIVSLGSVANYEAQIVAWESAALGQTATVSKVADGLSLPTQITADSRGNLYVTNFNNNTISKIVSGTVSTFVSGIRGTGIVADAADNLYVSDYASSSVKMISPSGTTSTLAGGISQPQGIAIDRENNLYVSEWVSGTIRKITQQGVVSTFAKGFYGPSGMAFDRDGNLYVADTYNHAIRKVTPQGILTTLAGKPGTSGSSDGNGATARFLKPFALAVDPTGNVYVTDTDNHTIRKITPSGEVTTIAGVAGASGNANGSPSAARFNAPRGPYLDSAGNLYIADSANNQIRKLSF